MSDKSFTVLTKQDQLLRQCHPVVGFCTNHVQCVIEKVCGFELFNTRPYHNYETWSDGYKVRATEESGIMDVRHGRDGTRLLEVSAEDLDDAIAAYAEAVRLWRDRPAEVAP